MRPSSDGVAGRPRARARARARARVTANFANFRGAMVKQINAFPLIMLLIVVIGMIYWFSGFGR